MNLVKLNNGDYRPAYGSDFEKSKKIKVGDEVYASKARNPKFHRLGFALLKLGHENQDRYEDFDAFRMVMTMKAGFYIEVPDKHGEVQFLPRSLSFEKMNADQFDAWYNAVKTVICKEIGTDDIEQEIVNYF